MTQLMKKPEKDSRRWVSHSVVARLKKYRYLLDVLKFLFHTRNRLRFSSTIKQNAKLRSTESHRPIALLGTGLSVLSVDLANLQDLALFGCNEIYKHEDFRHIHLDYYTATVPYFGKLFGAAYVEDFQQYFSEIDQAFRGRDTRLFFNASLKPFLRQNKLLSHSTTSFFLSENSVTRDESAEHDLSTPSFSFGAGALSFMIAAAVFMGAKEIYLLGCGYMYSPRMHNHFFDSLTLPVGTPDVEVGRAVEGFATLYAGYDITPVHIGDRNLYFSATDAFDEADANAELYWRLHQLAESQGVRIVNVVPPGFSSKIFDGVSTIEFSTRFCSSPQRS